MRNALTALPGVRHVHVDFDKKTVTVSVEKTASTDDDRFVKALDEEGFGATIKDRGERKTATPDSKK